MSAGADQGEYGSVAAKDCQIPPYFKVYYAKQIRLCDRLAGFLFPAWDRYRVLMAVQLPETLLQKGVVRVCDTFAAATGETALLMIARVLPPPAS